MRRAAPALCLLALGWAATLWLAPWSNESVSDLYVYRVFSAPVLDGALPYRDAFLEYPPLAAPAIALPGLAGTGEDAFRWAFAVWTLALALPVVLLCGALAARTGGDVRRALLAAALLPLLCGALVRTRFDLAPVALLLAALWLLVSERPRAALAVLALATMTKGFPVVALPAALAWIRARAGRRTALESAAAFGAVVAVLAALALAASPSGALDALRYHVDRPVQVESLPALGVRALDALELGDARAVSGYRSDGLEHPSAPALVAACLLAMAIAIAGAAAAARGGPRQVALAVLTSVLAFAALGKVLSPQYMIWVVPLLALAFAWRLRLLAGTLVAAMVLTQVEFPARYFDLVDGAPFPVALVGLRDVLLLCALGAALAELRRGQQQLLDRAGAAPVALHEHRVEPRVLV